MTNKIKFNSIKTRLIVILLLLTILPTITVGWLAHKLMFENIRDERITTVGQVADAKHAQLAMVLTRANSRAQLFLSNLGAQCNITKLNQGCTAGLISSYLASEGAIGATVYKKGGGESLTVGDAAIPQGGSLSFKTGQLAKFSGTGVGNNLLYIISATENLTGLQMEITYPSSNLQSIFDRPAELGNSGETFLADGEGYFVTQARYPATQGHDLPIHAHPMQACMSGKNAEVIDLDYRDTEVIMGFRHVAEFGSACIMAHIDKEEAFSPLVARQNKLFAAILAFLILVLAVAVYLARNIAKPIRHLTKVARTIAKGNYTTQADVAGKDEITELSAAFNLMTRQLTSAIANHQQAENMLRFHSEILNNLSEGVLLVRHDTGTMVFANPQLERMLGYGPGELIGKHISIINAPGERSPEIVAKEINAALAKKRLWVGDVHNIKKDGTPIWCQVSVSVFEHPEFGEIGIAVHEDITERKALEKEIQERRIEMEELQKLHVAAQTASAIAHELNQPLLAIASYSKAALMMLKSGKPDLNEICNAITGSERQAHRAGQSIREMFDFLNSKGFPIEDFDLNQEIFLIIEDAKAGHDFQFQPVLKLEELPLVRANRTHVQKALFNLLRNGIEAMQESGVPLPFIIVTTSRSKDGSYAQITVQDNGPGFTKENAQHLFEPFFTTKADGFGMGLSISRSLIEMNSGQLWIDPQKGSGAIFHITIPFTS